MFPRDIFLDQVKYLKNLVGDHSKVSAHYYTRSLPDWKFCVLIHGSNFLSTFAYGREAKTPVEAGWTVERFLGQPVVFDVDDYCDQWAADTLECLDKLKWAYPNFRATLFTIPSKTSAPWLEEVKQRPWLELAVHGYTHEPNEELRHLTPTELGKSLTRVDWSVYTRGFRPPGWYITKEHVEVLNDHKMWVALHSRDRKTLGPLCQQGYYTCEDRWPYSHHHTHSVCGNWIRKDLLSLLKKWRPEQEFLPVGDAVLVPQGN